MKTIIHRLSIDYLYINHISTIYWDSQSSTGTMIGSMALDSSKMSQPGPGLPQGPRGGASAAGAALSVAALHPALLRAQGRGLEAEVKWGEWPYTYILEYFRIC